MANIFENVLSDLGLIEKRKSTTQKVLEGALWTAGTFAAAAAARKLTEDKTPKVSASSANKMKKRGSK